ncbi:MAG: ligase-associated DNA damage response endonuclease PdeM [Salaquimonas sp.]
MTVPNQTNPGQTSQNQANLVRQTPIALEDRASSVEIIVADEQLVCDWAGCLYWPDEATLIVSDLHLEKGSSFARKGSLVPPYDTGATLNRLKTQIDLWQPKRIISLGDSFHDPEAHERLAFGDLEILKTMMLGREWIWITGNHDPAPPQDLGGIGASQMLIRNLIFRHEPQKGMQFGEVAGHLHPAGKINRRYRSVRRPCFVTDTTRLIMPSFGAYTGGLNIRHDAFDNLFDQERLSAVLLGKNRVFHIAGKNLVG